MFTLSASSREVQVYDSPQVQAMLNGARKGYAGMQPSTQNVGGAPPIDNDPGEPIYQMAEKSLMAYANFLKQAAHDDIAANQALELITELGDIQLARRKKRADAAKNAIDNGGNAMSAVGGLNAMGVPGG